MRVTDLLRRVWPGGVLRGGVPPTVPGHGRPVFHCRDCKAVLDDAVRACPSCGRPV